MDAKCPRLLTNFEAADLLQLTPNQVSRMARAQRIPSVKLPNNELRFDEADLSRWVDSRKQRTEGHTK